MTTDTLYPVAYCNHCDETGPVVVAEAPSELSEGVVVEIIYCPGCTNILNFDTDLDLKFYDEDELEKATGWKVKND